MRSVLKRLSFEKKLQLLALVMVTASYLVGSYYIYKNTMIDISNQMGLRLEHIARTGSLLISGELHETLVEKYLNQDPQILESSEFKSLQKTLQQIQHTNNLTSDVYTLIHPDWSEGNVIFIGMSNEKPYLGNGLPFNPESLSTFEKGLAKHTGLHTDQEGTWISAFAPIKTKDERIVGMLQVDFNANVEVLAAQKTLLNNLIYSFVIVIMITWGLGLLVKQLSSNLLNLTTEVGSRADQVRGISQLVQQASSHLKSKADDQTKAVTNVVSSIKDVESTLKFQIGNTQKVEVASQDIYILAQGGSSEIKKMSESLDTTIQAIKGLDKIENNFAKISDLTQVIDDIVFKLNILSFNASIEAERAGVHGRGFGVVAKEVKDLVNMSGKASDEIFTNMNVVQKELKETFDKIRLITNDNREKSKIVQKSFINLESKVSDIPQIIDSVKNDLEQQLHTIHAIRNSVTIIDSMTENAVTASDDLQIVVKGLEKQSDSMFFDLVRMRKFIQGQKNEKKAS